MKIKMHLRWLDKFRKWLRVWNVIILVQLQKLFVTFPFSCRFSALLHPLFIKVHLKISYFILFLAFDAHISSAFLSFPPSLCSLYSTNRSLWFFWIAYLEFCEWFGVKCPTFTILLLPQNCRRYEIIWSEFLCSV